MSRSFFFAYGSQSTLESEAMRNASARLADQGLNSRTWEQLDPDGKWVTQEIIRAIRECDCLVAELGDMNKNVLYECGYALALNKSIRLAIDETDTEAVTKWKKIALLSPIGRTDYGGVGSALANKVAASVSEGPDSTLLEILLAGGEPKTENAVFCPALPHMFDAARDLERNLERKRYLKILGASEELGLAPLDFYVKTAYRSSAAVLHLMRDSRLQATEHNQRVCFIGGLLAGLDVPVLFVAEPGVDVPFDIAGDTFSYTTSAQLQKYVDVWLDKLPKDPGGKTRLGRRVLDIELPLDSFGQYVAEYERDGLERYYVHTGEFRAVLDGTASVFVGRKGTGKTATMGEVTRELRKDRGNLVVPIKPSSYETSGLLGLLATIGSVGNREYFLQGLWKYLVFSEVALRILQVARGRSAGVQSLTPVATLEELVDGFGISDEQDMSVRLEDAVARVAAVLAETPEPDQTAIARALNQQRTERLVGAIRPCLAEFSRVAVLFDNLDKAWDADTHAAELSEFLLALLVARGRIEHDLMRSAGELQVTATVFIRSDIFEVLLGRAREPDKIGAASVEWHDHELLLRVLEDRYAVNRRTKAPSDDLAMWRELFVDEIHGRRVRDYFTWRALPRPRDLIYLANGALTAAINRKHNRIEADDIRQAEKSYSKFAFNALVVESRRRLDDPEGVLFLFIGEHATLPESAVVAKLEAEKLDAAAVSSWLVASGFLGVEHRAGVFEHVESMDEAARRLQVGRSLAAREERDLRFRVHPAYRPYLEIVEDDIHDDNVTDGTLRRA